MDTKKLLEVVPMVQSVSLVNENLKDLKKKKSKDFIKTGIKNIVGINLIKANSDLISTL